LREPVTLGLWTYNSDPEPVDIFNVEFYQDTFQLACVDYYMFRSGRPDFRDPWYMYRHEFSREFVDETFKVPAYRLTNLSRDGSRGRRHQVKEVAVGPAPDDFFIRGWEVIESLPTDPFAVPKSKAPGPKPEKKEAGTGNKEAGGK
jgi:hypothetical protein